MKTAQARLFIVKAHSILASAEKDFLFAAQNDVRSVRLCAGLWRCSVSNSNHSTSSLVRMHN